MLYCPFFPFKSSHAWLVDENLSVEYMKKYNYKYSIFATARNKFGRKTFGPQNVKEVHDVRLAHYQVATNALKVTGGLYEIKGLLRLHNQI